MTGGTARTAPSTRLGQQEPDTCEQARLARQQRQGRVGRQLERVQARAHDKATRQVDEGQEPGRCARQLEQQATGARPGVLGGRARAFGLRQTLRRHWPQPSIRRSRSVSGLRACERRETAPGRSSTHRIARRPGGIRPPVGERRLDAPSTEARRPQALDGRAAARLARRLGIRTGASSVRRAREQHPRATARVDRRPRAQRLRRGRRAAPARSGCRCGPHARTATSRRTAGGGRSRAAVAQARSGA